MAYVDEPKERALAEQRVTNGVCPECKAPLKGLNVEAHSMIHWPARIVDRAEHELAIFKQKLLTDLHFENLKAAREAAKKPAAAAE